MGENVMAHVVAEPCINCLDTRCVTVCPADSFRQGDQMLYIHPAECIDCESCVTACPVGAIFHESDLPLEWLPFRDLNATMARQSPAKTGNQNQLFQRCLGVDEP
jgi:ferredoxin